MGPGGNRQHIIMPISSLYTLPLNSLFLPSCFSLIRRMRTVIATQPCELFVIPRSALLPLLSPGQVLAARRRVAQQQMQRQGRMDGGGGLRQQQKGATSWPEAAGVLREYLRTLPGTRPAWQVRGREEGGGPRIDGI